VVQPALAGSTQQQQNESEQDDKGDEEPNDFMVRVTHAPHESAPGPLQTPAAEMTQQRILVVNWIFAMGTNIVGHKSEG